MISVVVLSYRNERTLSAAVDSLLSQDVPVEVVVSHSGGGDAAERIARLRPGVTVVASEARRTPGAARNAGLARTSAPIVAFLAGDCVARPGWARARLRLHRAGAEVVASALEPLHARPVAVAAHMLQNSFRMAHLDPAPRFRSGASYDRALLETIGPFPEQVPFGEDAALNDAVLASAARSCGRPR